MKMDQKTLQLYTHFHIQEVEEVEEKYKMKQTIFLTVVTSGEGSGRG